MTSPKYLLTIDLNALNHLGLNLYSTSPAVLSEVVANAWDADAELVTIDIDDTAKTVTIHDDGSGMTQGEVNQRYLRVGYDKRADGVKLTPIFQRPVMGRKGIGKLSLFSIAKTIEVHTVKTDGKGKVVERNGFIMRAAKIRKAIDEQGGLAEYEPDVVPPSKVTIKKGTRIQISDLKGTHAPSQGFLRTRLARRFSILGPEYKFVVKANGKAIGIDDRDYYKKLQFVWYFGDKSKPYADLCTKKKRSTLVSPIVTQEPPYEITGWIGTFDERASIDDGNNTIIVQARGKLVHEDLLKNIDEGGVFTKYLIGEIHADFLDLDDQADLATSDRQRLVEDDPRFQALRAYIESIIKSNIKLKWTDWRNEIAEEVAREDAAIDEWFQSLGDDHKGVARDLFGKIETLHIIDRAAKTELYRQSIIAFETLAFRKNLAALGTLTSGADVERFVRVVGNLDELEARKYAQIVKGRLEILERFEGIKTTALEKVLQKIVFDHLWLLDASWERASTDQGMEVLMKKAFAKVTAKLTTSEKNARLDIKYRTAAGKHIVIELKKYDRQTSVFALAKQVGKYKSAMTKVLQAQFPADQQPIEFICILGSAPEEYAGDPSMVDNTLAAQSARFVTYDALLKSARESYSQYLEAQEDVARLEELIASIA